MSRSIVWQIVLGAILVVLALPHVRALYFGSGLRWQYILIFSFVLSCLLTPFCRLLALRLNILDRPDWRKIHAQPTPLMGGVSIYLAFSMSLLINGIFLPGMKALLLGVTLVFLVGLIDDIKP
ncbi:MAG: hypothetical protein JRI79_11860, partial [Deltaproteobacteria bacterium]|nr:hypothetical protein [Deltaproteobacteria bacterium]MBW1978643.1 hypothetical protein [Deltaproteobacteria bacterium]